MGLPHYICTGDCKGVSEMPGVCQSQTCPRFNQPLFQCECTDEKHKDVFRGENDAAKKPEPQGNTNP